MAYSLDLQMHRDVLVSLHIDTAVGCSGWVLAVAASAQELVWAAMDRCSVDVGVPQGLQVAPLSAQKFVLRAVVALRCLADFARSSPG